MWRRCCQTGLYQMLLVSYLLGSPTVPNPLGCLWFGNMVTGSRCFHCGNRILLSIHGLSAAGEWESLAQYKQPPRSSFFRAQGTSHLFFLWKINTSRKWKLVSWGNTTQWDAIDNKKYHGTTFREDTVKCKKAEHTHTHILTQEKDIWEPRFTSWFYPRSAVYWWASYLSSVPTFPHV